MPNKMPQTAVQINLFPLKDGLMFVPFSAYDDIARTTIEIGRFVIPWCELHGIIDRMDRIEKSKLEVDIGIAPF